MKSDHGTFELDVPRDRNGSFEPEIVKKNALKEMPWVQTL
jgi:transposase-like protein